MDPARIGFLQYPEFHKLGKRAQQKCETGLSGDWDQVLERTCFWGARYEGGRDHPMGMVPLDNYKFYSALREHFQKGLSWEETEWYKWMQDNAPSRYNTLVKIKSRVSFLDALYEACKDERYEMRTDDPPRINVGRDGRIAIEDGRHRVCVARAAGLKRILVKVNAVHPKFAGEHQF